MVGADAFAAAVSGEFGGEGEGAGFEFFDGVAVGLDEVDDVGVAAGEVVEGGAAVGASGGDGDGDAGEFGVDFEVGFAADGEAWGLGGSVGLGGWSWAHCGIWRSWFCQGAGHQIETCGGCCGWLVLRQNPGVYARRGLCSTSTRVTRLQGETMPLNRRTFLGTTAAAGAGVAVAGGTACPPRPRPSDQDELAHGHGRHEPKRYAFTVMGTTDLHGHVFNWDYFTDKEYDDAAHNDVGSGEDLDAGGAGPQGEGPPQHAADRRG